MFIIFNLLVHFKPLSDVKKLNFIPIDSRREKQKVRIKIKGKYFEMCTLKSRHNIYFVIRLCIQFYRTKS